MLWLDHMKYLLSLLTILGLACGGTEDTPGAGLDGTPGSESPDSSEESCPDKAHLYGKAFATAYERGDPSRSCDQGDDCTKMVLILTRSGEYYGTVYEVRRNASFQHSAKTYTDLGRWRSTGCGEIEVIGCSARPVRFVWRPQGKGIVLEGISFNAIEDYVQPFIETATRRGCA